MTKMSSENKKDEELTEYRFSVKDIVQFCCLTGDLRSETKRPPTAEQGRLAQKHLQKQRGDLYQIEVPVKTSVSRQGYKLTIGGRIDGLESTHATPLRIEEIKATGYDEASLPHNITHLHSMQALFYAAIHLESTERIELPERLPSTTSVELVVLYWDIHNKRSFQRATQWDTTSLLQKYRETIAQFCHWLDRHHVHCKTRNNALSQLEFPFSEYRVGQRALAVAVFRNVRDKEQLIAHAATGLGKTVATLYPTLKALGQGHVRQIWYTTAKNSGKAALRSALNALEQKGLKHKSLFLSAKSESCFCDKTINENLKHNRCEWETGYFDRRMQAMENLFDLSIIDFEALQIEAKNQGICPHQLAKEMIPWMDIVCGDFNYVYDLVVRPSDYFQQAASQIALLVDESHNLPDRARSMYSATLRNETIKAAIKAAPAKTRLSRQIKKLNSVLLSLKSTESLPPTQADLPTPLSLTELPTALIPALSNTLEAYGIFYAEQTQLFVADELVSLWSEIHLFHRLTALWGTHFSLMLENTKKELALSLRCINPAPVLEQINTTFNSATLFSGTLLPLTYYQANFFGLENDSINQISLGSPFDQQRLGVFIAPINTRFGQRDNSLPAIADYVKAACGQTETDSSGIYLIACASYAYLDKVLEYLKREEKWQAWTLLQQPSDPALKAQFLNQIHTAERAIVFVILGGSFAEGIEFQPNRLRGTIIVGTGIPAPDTERELQQRYWQKTLSQGFNYAYLYPGINRVIQTAGRVIRRDTDAGFILLLEERFLKPQYQMLLPHEWQINTVSSPLQLTQALCEFWNSQALPIAGHKEDV